MKKFLLSTIGVILFVAFVENAGAQSAQNQTLSLVIPSMIFFQVTPTTSISLAPVYNPLATPTTPIQATDNTSRWSFRSNSTSTYKLSASINNSMPSNTTLQVNVTAVGVSGGTGTTAGNINLGTSAQDCVTNITGQCGGTITYTFIISSESVAANPGLTQTVTWTVAP